MEPYRSTRQGWKHSNLGRSCGAGNGRVGSVQMARKSMRAGSQRLKSNLSLLGLHTPPHCQQNGQMQTTGARKVGDGSLSQASYGACQGYLTNANPSLFSCTWGGLSMQWVYIQILCAQTQPLPFEILALNASSFCCNAWSLGLRVSEERGSLSVVPRSPGDFHRAGKAHRLSEAQIWGLEPIVWQAKENRHCSGVLTVLAQELPAATCRLAKPLSQGENVVYVQDIVLGCPCGTTSEVYWT